MSTEGSIVTCLSGGHRHSAGQGPELCIAQGRKHVTVLNLAGRERPEHALHGVMRWGTHHSRMRRHVHCHVCNEVQN